MNKRPWYEELFQDYANKYESESFVQGTIGEVDFLEDEIHHDKSKSILDVGCGTGRHAIELAKRGYKVTGIDLSESMLEKAREKADSENLEVNFIKKDARDFNFQEQFDLSIMLCEGAFPLMETDEMNYKILENIYTSIREGGKMIFTTLNGLFPLFHSAKEFIEQNSTKSNFDLMTFRDYSLYETTDDNGNKKTLHTNERYYVPSEITWLLKSLGFSEIDICGCKLGAFNRNDKLSTDDFEMLVIAHK